MGSTGEGRRIDRVPVVTAVLLVAMVIVFLWQQRLSGFSEAQLILAFGLNPAHLFGYRAPSPHMGFVPVAATLLTYVMLHDGWVHLLGNALFLLMFGPTVEGATGSFRFAGLFLVAAVVSGLAQAAVLAESQVHLIGASGAISGLIGAYLMLFPRGRLIVFICLWFGLQLAVMLLVSTTAGNVAFVAHIAGFVCGVAMAPILRRPGLAMFGDG